MAKKPKIKISVRLQHDTHKGLLEFAEKYEMNLTDSIERASNILLNTFKKNAKSNDHKTATPNQG